MDEWAPLVIHLCCIVLAVSAVCVIAYFYSLLPLSIYAQVIFYLFDKSLSICVVLDQWALLVFKQTTWVLESLAQPVIDLCLSGQHRWCWTPLMILLCWSRDRHRCTVGDGGIGVVALGSVSSVIFCARAVGDGELGNVCIVCLLERLVPSVLVLLAMVLSVL